LTCFREKQPKNAAGIAEVIDNGGKKSYNRDRESEKLCAVAEKLCAMVASFYVFAQ